VLSGSFDGSKRPSPSSEEVKDAAREWASFLYDLHRRKRARLRAQEARDKIDEEGRP
jgi:hypothetical protein